MNTKVIGVILLGIILLIIAGFAGYWYGQRDDARSNVTDFASCEGAGYLVMESDPRQCRTPEGVLYVEDKTPGSNQDQDEMPTSSTKEFTSKKGVVLRLYDWVDNKELSSPITIKGEVPGNWSFEASFPVVVTNWDGLIIAEKPAQLEGDWMTENFVPFSVDLTFETPTVYKNGSLILRKDNPSGLPENDDAVEIPINFR